MPMPSSRCAIEDVSGRRSRFWSCRCRIRRRPDGSGLRHVVAGREDGNASHRDPNRSMSEYQYYEFHAIDRPLTERQMRELRAISSRAAISRTRFSNHYTFGDLKADPRELLATYFDASLYFANWHFVELAFRFPTSVVDVKSLRQYR